MPIKLRSQLIEENLMLLKPVGQFRAISIGKALVYDLGGNVAAYAADGTCIGFSACDQADTLEGGNSEKEKCGFRVILEL